jgi:hypothetical protein
MRSISSKLSSWARSWLCLGRVVLAVPEYSDSCACGKKSAEESRGNPIRSPEHGPCGRRLRRAGPRPIFVMRGAVIGAAAECRFDKDMTDDETELWGPSLSSGVRAAGTAGRTHGEIGGRGLSPLQHRGGGGKRLSHHAGRRGVPRGGPGDHGRGSPAGRARPSGRGWATASSCTAASPAAPSSAAFVLADGVEVAGASMEHGLLHIDLRRAVPETVVQTIRIGRADRK